MPEGPEYDVAVLGSGLGGSTLATVLARQGRRVLLLERGRHPRFAVGESLVPEFSFRAKLLAATYDVPELADMSNFRLLSRRVSARTGIKRNFTFLHHRANTPHVAQHSCQFQAMTHPLGPDAHVYRADLDEWLTGLAVQYGADYHDETPVDGVTEDDGGVTIRAGERRFRAGFAVDATGHHQVVATGAVPAPVGGERPDPGFLTDSRSIFTHMVGVRGVLEATGGPLPVPSPPDQGTLHHVFDGGWFWIIPFGNHRAALSPLTSVGLTLDRRRFPDEGLPAAEEFAQFVQRLPTVARQLAGARAVRPWVKTGRIQYRAQVMAGTRWCLLPHAAGFIDALFSGGMAATMAGVHQVARALIDAPVPAPDVLARIAATTTTSLEGLDRVVHGAYLAFASHALFDAFYRIWALANYHASLGLVRIWLKHRAGQPEALADIDRDPYRHVLAAGQPRVRMLVDQGHEWLARHAAGEIGEAAAVDGIFALLAAQDWIPPQFHATARGRTHLASFSFFPMVAMILWGKRHAPADIRAAYYDVPPTYFNEVGRYVGTELWRGWSTAARQVRDAFWSSSRA